jgi:glycosyltransferase involved in cell wall biosynthesis
VIVATRDRADLLSRLLDRVEELRMADHRAELIVVDDGSRDGTPELLGARVRAAAFPALALRAGGGGANPARNAAARAAAGEVLVFLDDDCLPAAGHLSALARVLAAHPVQYGGGPVPFPHEPAPPADRAVRIPAGRLVPPGAVAGGNLFVLRDAFAALGGLRTDIGPGRPIAFSDAEFATRASLAGYEGVWSASLAVVHAPDGLDAGAAERTRDRWDRGRGAYFAELALGGRRNAWALWRDTDAAAGDGADARAARLRREFAGAADHLARLADGGGPLFAAAEVSVAAASPGRRD